ncbi:MAG: class I SAM-dependent methyltransferase [Gemmataceae bacterium]|nr:class I SAM-dependent methyltransferase [Gemmataceae bacterium]
MRRGPPTALLLPGRGCRVTGIDFLEEPIQRARRKAAGRGLPATFLFKDALTLKDWTDRFDLSCRPALVLPKMNKPKTAEKVAATTPVLRQEMRQEFGKSGEKRARRANGEKPQHIEK